MSEYNEYGDKASGKNRPPKGKHTKGNDSGGKHSKPPPGGDQGTAGGSSGCMVAVSLPAAVVGIVTTVLIRARRR